jgi:hypothetical protein
MVDTKLEGQYRQGCQSGAENPQEPMHGLILSSKSIPGLNLLLLENYFDIFACFIDIVLNYGIIT